MKVFAIVATMVVLNLGLLLMALLTMAPYAAAPPCPAGQEESYDVGGPQSMSGA